VTAGGERLTVRTPPGFDAVTVSQHGKAVPLERTPRSITFATTPGRPYRIALRRISDAA